MRQSHVFTAILMDTLIRIEVISPDSFNECSAKVDRAFSWFVHVEKICSRFDPESEVSALCRHVDAPVRVSELLFSVLDFALNVARESDGAFDPTVGLTLEARGFDQNYITGQHISSCIDPTKPHSYRDVVLDRELKTVTLLSPLLLDLGAVAKGFAMDLAARELDYFEDFAIDAGGDLLVRGLSVEGSRWSIGIQHPRRAHELITIVSMTDGAVCTSGDYERLAPGADGGHHIVEPGSGKSANEVASVTTIAETAMAADALSTAAFVLGPARGIGLLNRQGVDGLIVTPDLKRYETPGFSRHEA